MNDRIIDYRPETPRYCPVCGKVVRITGEERGRVHLSGPADMNFAAKYGITTEGSVTTIWNTYTCPHGHHGPVLLA